jgi:hypothetical protein
VDELWRVTYERAPARTNLEDIMAVGVEWKRLEAEVKVNVTVSSSYSPDADVRVRIVRTSSRSLGRQVYITFLVPNPYYKKSNPSKLSTTLSPNKQASGLLLNPPKSPASKHQLWILLVRKRLCGSSSNFRLVRASRPTPHEELE